MTGVAPLAWSLDPIIPISDWRDHYTTLLDRITYVLDCPGNSVP